MDGVLPRKLGYTPGPMRFRSQAEMDQNAKQWIVVLLIGLAGISTVLMAVALLANDDVVATLLKLFAPR